MFVLFIAPPVFATANSISIGQQVSLEDIRVLVHNQNRDIQNQLLRARSADLSVYSEHIEFDWKSSPFVSATSSSNDDALAAGLVFSRRYSNNIEFSTTPKVSERDGAYRGSLDAKVTIPLFKGFGKETAEDKLNIAKHNYQIEELEALQTIRTQLVEAIGYAYRVNLQIQIVKEQQRYKNTLEKQVKATLVKVKAKLANKIDVYRAEIALNNAKTALNSAQQQLVDTRERLNRILGLSGSVELIPVLPEMFDLPKLSDAELSLRAIDSSFTLAQEKAKVAEARRRVSVAQKNVKPQLDLVVSAGMSGHDNFSFSGEDSFTVSLQSDFEFGQRKEKSNFQQARIFQRQQDLQYEDEKEQVVVRAKKSRRELMSQNEKKMVAEDQIAESRSKHSLAVLRFTNGLATNFDVIEAEREVNAATLEHMLAISNFMGEVYRFMSLIGALQEKLPAREGINERFRP